MGFGQPRPDDGLSQDQEPDNYSGTGCDCLTLLPAWLPEAVAMRQHGFARHRPVVNVDCPVYWHDRAYAGAGWLQSNLLWACRGLWRIGRMSNQRTLQGLVEGCATCRFLFVYFSERNVWIMILQWVALICCIDLMSDDLTDTVRVPFARVIEIAVGAITGRMQMRNCMRESGY